MIPVPRALVASASLLILAACDAPEEAERTAYLTLMGNDTLAVEWIEFDDDVVDAEALIRGSRTTFGRYHLEFGDDGQVAAYTARTYAGGDATGELLRTDELVIAEDGSRSLVTTQGGDERSREVDAQVAAVPFIDILHWPFEASLRWQIDENGAIGEEVPILGGQPFPVTRNSDGSWSIRHPSRGPSTARIDDMGRITELDGTGSTRAYDLRRLDYDAVDKTRMAELFADRPLGELSGRGQIDDRVAGIHFTGDYGVPRKRGRDIFGGLLSYGTWWRTGANAATQLSFDGDIVIDGVVVPAGDYSLSSIPEEDGGTLIINRRTGQGGQSYDEAEDQARVRLRRDMLDEVVEEFEIRAVEAEGGGRIELRWDDTVYWVPFSVR